MRFSPNNHAILSSTNNNLAILSNANNNPAIVSGSNNNLTFVYIMAEIRKDFEVLQALEGLRKLKELGESDTQTKKEKKPRIWV